MASRHGVDTAHSYDVDLVPLHYNLFQDDRRETCERAITMLSSC